MAQIHETPFPITRGQKKLVQTKTLDRSITRSERPPRVFPDDELSVSEFGSKRLSWTERVVDNRGRRPICQVFFSVATPRVKLAFASPSFKPIVHVS